MTLDLPEGSHDLSAEERKKLDLAATAIAIKIKWTNRGFQKNDVVVAVEGQRTGMTASDFIAFRVQHKKPGDKIALTVLRAGKELKMHADARAAPIE